MTQWLLSKLVEFEMTPNPKFAFQGTVNWMRALAILCDSSDLEKVALRKCYSKIKGPEISGQKEAEIFQNLLMSLSDISALTAIRNNPGMAHELVRQAVVSWYYSTYWSGRALMALKSTVPETHAGLAKVWQATSISLPSPFDLSIDNLMPNEIESQIKALREGNSHDLNSVPKTHEEAFGAYLSYLKGTAAYEREKIENRVRQSPQFKMLGKENFKSNVAKELRDPALIKGYANFFSMAFRFRGKAHYRDAIYLTYGDDREDAIKIFITDMEAVAKAFFRTCSVAISRKTQSGKWEKFATDIKNNARFDFDESLLDVEG
tara:strand:+ start:72985 stop:73944 length:960 start_codon:yes stop_codon:yes gene_type:complete